MCPGAESVLCTVVALVCSVEGSGGTQKDTAHFLVYVLRTSNNEPERTRAKHDRTRAHTHRGFLAIAHSA